MENLTITHKGKKYKFRFVNDSDLTWIAKRFSTDNLTNGFENFKVLMMSINENYEEMIKAVFVFMHRLNLDKFKTVQDFIEDFGSKVKDNAVLYQGMGQCLGNSMEQVDLARKNLDELNKLKSKNRILEIKVKTLGLKLKAEKKKHKRRK